ncbi:MAG TPA: hypothetical protein VIT91_12285 [Chthoniobacterales bacterium]
MDDTEPPILERPAQRLLSLLAPGGPRRILIGLAGLPGSGKSTFAAKLADEVNELAGQETMIALGMDGFHLTRAALLQLPNPDEALARRGAPWTFDPQGMAARLQVLRDAAGRAPVSWPDFKHEVRDPEEDVFTIGPDTRLVLVEGLYVLLRTGHWDAVTAAFDERWFLDIPLELALQRLAERHMTAWGLTRADAEARIAANDRLNADVVLQSRSFADWRLPGFV